MEFNLINLIRQQDWIQMRWEQVRAAGGVGPGGKWGHTCNVQNGRYVYVFGGYAPGRLSNDIHVFDSVTQTWNRPRIYGNPPCPRCSHTCTTVGTNLFIFGGTDVKILFSDLHVFNTMLNTWIQPIVRGAWPNAREGHSAVLIDKKIYYFGGYGMSFDTHEKVYYNDLFMLDTDEMIWKHLVTSGTPPCCCGNPTCSSWNKKVIVIGGENSYCLHMLDTDTLAWVEIRTKGDMFPPRTGHMTIKLGNKLLVFGGLGYDGVLYDDLYLLSIETMTWRKVAPFNQGPSPRFSLAGDSVDEQKGILFLFGGCNQSLQAQDDIYYLHTDMSVSRESIKRELKRKYLTELASSNRFEMLGAPNRQLRSAPASDIPLRLSHLGISGDGPTSAPAMLPPAAAASNRDYSVTGEVQSGITDLVGMVPHEMSETIPVQITGNDTRRVNPLYRPRLFLRPAPHLQSMRFFAGPSQSDPNEPFQNQDKQREH